MNALGAHPSRWNVPYKQNPFFTGREELLNSLHDALHAENVVALSHPQGISGLGGIGKTQTAVEYAYRCREEYDVILWVRADSSSALTSSYVDLAHLLDIPEQDERDQSIIVEAVLRWLRLYTGWLLIFDGMDDLAVAEPFLPPVGPGHILYTTRAHALGGIAQPLEVPKMQPETGALLLLRRSDILHPQAMLNVADEDDRRVACAISQELGGLPLALDQAGAYIKEAPCTLTDYVALYRTRRRDVLQTRGSLDKDYPASVATTWSLSFEKVKQINSAAAELLDFCSFLAPDVIPEEIITTGAQHLTPSLQVTATNPLKFDQAIATLLAYSLVGRNENATLTIHRLVQAVLQDSLEEKERYVWRERAVQTVNVAFPQAVYETWSLCERLLSQALRAADYIETDHIAGEEVGRLLHEIASYLQDRARYKEAEPLYRRALSIREQQLGAEHPDVASSLNGLANLCVVQGRYAEAESLYQRALSIREQQLGPEHPDVASSLGGLAILYQEQGKYAEAESLYQRALRIKEQQLGSGHLNIADSLHNLAGLYHEQGKYTEAEPLYQRALHIREQQLGPEHQNTAESLNNLADLYVMQGRYAEADPLYQRALRIWEQQLGPDHPQIAYALNGLAVAYTDLGKYAEAESLYQRALHIREQHLGTQHPETAEIIHDFAKLWEAQGNYKEATSLYAHALTIYELALGADHPKTTETRRHLIALLHALGLHEDAAQLETTQSKQGKSE